MIKSDVDRVHRLALIRETFSRVAEAQVKEAEGQVREIELEDERMVRTILSTRADFAERSSLSGHEVQQNEKHVDSLVRNRRILLQSLEKAKIKLAQKRDAWVETRREQKIVEKIEERRLQQWRRQEETTLQKFVDDTFIGRLVRSRLQE